MSKKKALTVGGITEKEKSDEKQHGYDKCRKLGVLIYLVINRCLLYLAAQKGDPSPDINHDRCKEERDHYTYDNRSKCRKDLADI